MEPMTFSKKPGGQPSSSGVFGAAATGFGATATVTSYSPAAPTGTLRCNTPSGPAVAVSRITLMIHPPSADAAIIPRARTARAGGAENGSDKFRGRRLRAVGRTDSI